METGNSTGKLSPDFLLPEQRCGYPVSGKMKKIWAVELDLLSKFTQVCEKHGLSYFMDGGTLLGAVRHKGFIPWDDDADIIMPREDYDRLWEIAAQEFTEPYFFQTALSENGLFRTHAQLRNSKTTGFIHEDKDKNINKGIFIDIFVLDSIPDSSVEKHRFRRSIELAKKMGAYKYDLKFSQLNPKRKIIYCIMKIFFAVVPFKKFFKYFNKRILAKYRNTDTRTVGDVTLEWRENVQWSRECYNGYVNLPFEHLTLRAPIGYDEILKKQYGDYMNIPKDINAPNGRSHGEVTFDPDTPYELYFQKQEKKE